MKTLILFALSALGATLVNASPPTVVTLAADGVGNEVAGLRGTVNPNGEMTTAQFEYGAGTNYGNSTPALNLGSGASDLSVSNFVSCLVANTTYHFRLVASNSAGTSYGADQVFATSNVLDIARALDTTCLVWTSGGDSTFSSFSSATGAHDGVDAIRSGSGMGENGRRTASIETTVVGPGTVAFWWRGDYCQSSFAFSVDSVELASVRSVTACFITNWVQKTFLIGPGTHVLKWKHVFDPFLLVEVYLDQVRFIPDSSPPWIIVQPTNLTVRLGLNASFAVTAYGSETLSYQWQFNGTNLFNQTNATLLVTNAQLAQAGGYAVVITNNYGSITSVLATLSVAILPTIVQQPQPVTAVEGENATFTVVVTNTATLPITYRWVRNGVEFLTNVLDSTSCTLTLVDVRTNTVGLTNGAGRFYVRIINAAGFASSHTSFSTLAVIPAVAPSVVTLAATNIGGTSATLTGTVNPRGATTSARFEYGLTASYGSSTPTFAVGNDTNSMTVSNPVTGLSPGTTYHFRLVAGNAGGTNFGGDQTFTTSATPLALTLTSPAQQGSQFSVSITTVIGATYHLECTPSLGATNWTAVANVSGNGFVQNLIDFSATNAQSFYRVRVE